MIRATLISHNSRRDRCGNCYWAFTWVADTGQRVFGIVSGGESNITGISRAMGLAKSEVCYVNRELPIREFDRLTKRWAYAGCTPEELAAFIRSQLDKPS